MTADPIDLGHDHWLTFHGRLNDPTHAKVGASIDHFRPDTGAPCVGAITFDPRDVPQAEGLSRPGRYWRVLSLEPLTLDPSIACACGDHGWIRNGRWEAA